MEYAENDNAKNISFNVKQNLYISKNPYYYFIFFIFTVNPFQNIVHFL